MHGYCWAPIANTLTVDHLLQSIQDGKAKATRSGSTTECTANRSGRDHQGRSRSCAKTWIGPRTNPQTCRAYAAADHQFDSRIDVASQVRFLNLVADALDDECLGIRLAQSIELRELGLLYYVQASSATLGDALARVARYSSIQNEGVRLNFRRDTEPTMSFEYVGVRRISDCHHTELLVAFLVRLCRHLSGRKLIPSHVRFVHRRKAHSIRYQVFFWLRYRFRRRSR